MPGQVRRISTPTRNGDFTAVEEIMTDGEVRVRVTRGSTGATILRLGLDDLFDIVELLDDICDTVEEGQR